jgi:transcriptional regulator with XRE-family HTH domain
MAQGHRLDDAEREYRRVLGLRLAKAAELAGLSKTRLAELTGELVPSMSQYMKGTRHVPPEMIDRIAQVTGVSVEDLLAGEDEPMTAEGPEGRCPAGYVIEASYSRLRVAVLLICDQRRHSDETDHRDPRGLAWRSAAGT